MSANDTGESGYTPDSVRFLICAAQFWDNQTGKAIIVPVFATKRFRSQKDKKVQF